MAQKYLLTVPAQVAAPYEWLTQGVHKNLGRQVTCKSRAMRALQ